MTAGYAVKRLSASLSPRDRRESGRAVPRGAHRARSALSASTRESTVAGRAARETLGVLGRNGEAPSDRSLGASVYRPLAVGWRRERNGSSAWTRTRDPAVNSRLLYQLSWCCPAPCSARSLRLLRASCLPQVSCSAAAGLRAPRVRPSVTARERSPSATVTKSAGRGRPSPTYCRGHGLMADRCEVDRRCAGVPRWPVLRRTFWWAR